MATPSKPPLKSAAKPRAVPATKPRVASVTKLRAAPVAKPRVTAVAKEEKKEAPFLRFYHSETLRIKTLTVLTALEDSSDPTKHRDALAKLVMELNDAGMDYCFLQPLKRAKPGFIVEQSASLGMSGALQVIGSVVRNTIGRMDKPQLLSVSASIRQLTR